MMTESTDLTRQIEMTQVLMRKQTLFHKKDKKNSEQGNERQQFINV